MPIIEVGSIRYMQETKAELKDFIERCFKRDFPDCFSNTNYMYYKKKYFDTKWAKDEAIAELYNLSYGGCHNSSWWADIKAMLSWWIKYGSTR